MLFYPLINQTISTIGHIRKSELTVLLEILSNDPFADGKVFSQKNIASKLNLHPVTVSKVFKSLIKKGFISKIIEDGVQKIIHHLVVQLTSTEKQNQENQVQAISTTRQLNEENANGVPSEAKLVNHQANNQSAKGVKPKTKKVNHQAKSVKSKANSISEKTNSESDKPLSNQAFTAPNTNTESISHTLTHSTANAVDVSDAEPEKSCSQVEENIPNYLTDSTPPNNPEQYAEWLYYRENGTLPESPDQRKQKFNFFKEFAAQLKQKSKPVGFGV
jgi:DNA-binding transcriptional regulator YhcF (GntR family)